MKHCLKKTIILLAFSINCLHLAADSIPERKSNFFFHLGYGYQSAPITPKNENIQVISNGGYITTIGFQYRRNFAQNYFYNISLNINEYKRNLSIRFDKNDFSEAAFLPHPGNEVELRHNLRNGINSNIAVTLGRNFNLNKHSILGTSIGINGSRVWTNSESQSKFHIYNHPQIAPNYLYAQSEHYINAGSRVLWVLFPTLQFSLVYTKQFDQIKIGTGFDINLDIIVPRKDDIYIDFMPFTNQRTKLFAERNFNFFLWKVFIGI